MYRSVLSVYLECGGKLEAPNGVIEMGNMMSLRAHTWQLTCEWDVVVKPGRMIRVDVTEMSTGSETSTSCNDNYLVMIAPRGFSIFRTSSDGRLFYFPSECLFSAEER